MRDFIKRALTKLNKLTADQIKDLIISAAAEIDRLESALDSLANGVIICDKAHRLVMANLFIERFLPLLGDSGLIWELIPDAKVADFVEQALKSGDRVEDREFDAIAKGANRLLSISILPLVQDKQVTGSLIFAEDITEKRGREAMFRRAESLASLTTLAAGVAHEIKNPLGSISIHIQLMRKAMAANKKLYFNAHPDETMDTQVGPANYFRMFDRYMGVVTDEIDRLNRIVVDFLFAVRPMDLDLREGDINRLIRDLAGFVSYEMETCRIAVALELSEKLPPVAFDERYMKQALLNLIKNAQAAMSEGGVLSIKTAWAEAGISISVSDTGTGISEENLPKVFEPYFTTKESGSGLGLTLVFKIVREHRGEITVKSRLGEGTTFTIRLPELQKERRLLPGGIAPGGTA